MRAPEFARGCGAVVRCAAAGTGLGAEDVSACDRAVSKISAPRHACLCDFAALALFHHMFVFPLDMSVVFTIACLASLKALRCWRGW